MEVIEIYESSWTLGMEQLQDPAKREPMIGSIPLGKFAEPEDISDAVLFLLSDRAVS